MTNDKPLQDLVDALGDDSVYIARYYECDHRITGRELAEAIDAFIKQRLNERKEG